MLQDDEADDDVDNDNEEEGDTDQLDSDEEQEETAQRFGGFTTKAKKGYGKLYFILSLVAKLLLHLTCINQIVCKTMFISLKAI